MAINMQAMVMTAVGDPDVLQLRSVPKPDIADPHQILVRVMAAGVTPADLRIRKRMPPMVGWEVPPEGIIQGVEAAGVIEAMGDAVTRFKVGDEVYYADGGFIGMPGNYAQFKVVDERVAARKPANLSFAEAAALPVVAVTSWESLHDRARLAAGERLLVQGGAGGLGHIGIQLGKLAGAQVAATVSTAAKADIARRMGADLVINYREENVAAAIQPWSGQGVDVVYDTVGDPLFGASVEMLGLHGRFVSAAYPTHWPDADIFKAALKNIHIVFEAMGHAFYSLETRIMQTAILERITDYVEDGKLQVVLDRTYPLVEVAEVAEAQRALDAGEITGRVALDIPH